MVYSTVERLPLQPHVTVFLQRIASAAFWGWGAEGMVIYFSVAKLSRSGSASSAMVVMGAD